MAEHHYEEEQIEAIKRWWQENRAFVAAGLIIGVGIVGGWRGWQWYMTHQAEAASTLYGELKVAVTAHDGAKSATLAQKLMDQYAMTPYAANAALLEAKSEVEAGKFAEAGVLLEWAVEHGKDVELKSVAQLRLARVRLAAGDAAAALKTLDGVSGAYEALAQDARGDAHAALGHPEDARKAWQAALAASDKNLADRQLIELKLDALGPAPVTPSAAAPTAAPGSKP